MICTRCRHAAFRLYLGLCGTCAAMAHLDAHRARVGPDDDSDDTVDYPPDDGDPTEPFPPEEYGGESSVDGTESYQANDERSGLYFSDKAGE